MLRLGWLVVATALLGALAGAQSRKITVEFPDQGDRLVYLQPNDKLHSAPEAPRTANGKAIDLETSLDPERDGQNVSVVILDRKKGNAGSKAFAEVAKSGSWKVADAELKQVASIGFVVKAAEGPVASGVLHLKASGLEINSLLTASDKGRVDAYLVDPGDVKATFEYKLSGQTKTLPEQKFEVKLGQAKPYEFTLDVPDKVDVAGPAAEPRAKGKTAAAEGDDEEDGTTKAVEKARKETPNAIGSVLSSLFSMVFGLLVVGGVAYGLWWYIKNNQKQVQTVLTQAGVPVNPDLADPTGAAPVAPQAPKPVEKIVLDPTASPVTAAPAPQTSAAKNPRLVGDDGSLHLLTDGDNVVGRETGLQVSITGESSVSRLHARVMVSGGQAVVSDAGSTNGTFVNGAKAVGSVPLRPGDSVQFGARRFRYEE